MFIHYSKYKINTINNTNQYDNIVKPLGLWFASDDTWLKYVEFELMNEYMPEFLDYDVKYKYKIKFQFTSVNNKNINKILLIKNNDDYNKLCIEYGFKNNHLLYLQYRFNNFLLTTFSDNFIDFLSIDWKKLSSDFGGIYFQNIYTYKINKKTIKLLNINYDKNINTLVPLQVENKIKYVKINVQDLVWSLSIDSGCVWNKNVIQSITEMKEDKLMKKIKLIRDKLKIKTDKVKTDKVKTDKVK